MVLGSFSSETGDFLGEVVPKLCRQPQMHYMTYTHIDNAFFYILRSTGVHIVGLHVNMLNREENM